MKSLKNALIVLALAPLAAIAGVVALAVVLEVNSSGN